ncbi:MAG TPA: hypothetical protein VLZ81_02280, partial [Blastocatellia bacterium]|nr:hypothetical protein [Blastocatellia bacterium]
MASTVDPPTVRPCSTLEQSQGPIEPSAAISDGLSSLSGDEFTLNYFNYLTEVEEEFVRRRGAHLLISPMDWALVESWKDAGIPLHIVMRGISKAFDGYEERGPKFRKVNSVLYCQQSVEESYAEYRLSMVGAAATGSDVEQTGNSDGAGGASQSSGGHRARARGSKGKRQAEGFSREALIDFISRCESELRQAILPIIPSSHQPGSGEGPQESGGDIKEAVARAQLRLDEIRQALEAAPEIDAESLERDL